MPITRIFTRLWSRNADPAPTGPEKYSVAWQLDRALERVRELERTVHDLQERRVTEAQSVAKAQVASAGNVAPFEDLQEVKSVTPAPPPHDFEALKKTTREERRHAREWYARVTGQTYEHVRQLDAEGKIPQIHNPAWREMIDRRRAGQPSEARPA